MYSYCFSFDPNLTIGSLFGGQVNFVYDWERIQTETYLFLLRNAAEKKAEARKRISANGDDIEAASCF